MVGGLVALVDRVEETSHGLALDDERAAVPLGFGQREHGVHRRGGVGQVTASQVRQRLGDPDVDERAGPVAGRGPQPPEQRQCVADPRVLSRCGRGHQGPSERDEVVLAEEAGVVVDAQVHPVDVGDRLRWADRDADRRVPAARGRVGCRVRSRRCTGPWLRRGARGPTGRRLLLPRPAPWRPASDRGSGGGPRARPARGRPGAPDAPRPGRRARRGGPPDRRGCRSCRGVHDPRAAPRGVAAASRVRVRGREPPARHLDVGQRAGTAQDVRHVVDRPRTHAPKRRTTPRPAPGRPVDHAASPARAAAAPRIRWSDSSESSRARWAKPNVAVGITRHQRQAGPVDGDVGGQPAMLVGIHHDRPVGGIGIGRRAAAIALLRRASC